MRCVLIMLAIGALYLAMLGCTKPAVKYNPEQLQVWAVECDGYTIEYVNESRFDYIEEVQLCDEPEKEY